MKFALPQYQFCQVKLLTLFIALIFISTMYAQEVTGIYTADNGNGTYTNPVFHADYSDPDVIRVGNDFYLIASSFNQVPGLPILHSKDLVNWTIIGHVFKNQPPFDRFNTVQHGGGVWAPSIRYHNGLFYVYYPDPDLGIYMCQSKNITGPWSEPLLVKQAKGWIDPCPFWDDNGNAYLVNGIAASRSGIKSILILSKMSSDGTKLLDDGVMIFDGHDKHPTVEGPKLYKRNGYYYILAPAGGVGQGWQLALRSKNIDGPYEEKVILEQGLSTSNGPHQGGLVTTQTGESWFLHFQDKDTYGRIVHLEPVTWKNDWPIIGIDKDGNGIGEPVITHNKPNVGKQFLKNSPATTDEFNSNTLGLQWQWAANQQANFCFPAGIKYGFLRLFNVPIPENAVNLWMVPNLLTQKFPAPNFSATTKITFTPRTNEEEVGLIITGIDYAYISLKQTQQGLLIGQTVCIDAEHGKPESKSLTQPIKSNTIYLKVDVKNVQPSDVDFAKYDKAENSKYGNAVCRFSYSLDGENFTPIGEPFAAKKGKWIGSKVGLFAIRKGSTYETGYADVDWFRVNVF